MLILLFLFVVLLLLHSPMAVWEKAAQAEEVLVPIRILIDQDGVKYKDDFTWNFNGAFSLVQ